MHAFMHVVMADESSDACLTGDHTERANEFTGVVIADWRDSGIEPQVGILEAYWKLLGCPAIKWWMIWVDDLSG